MKKTIPFLFLFYFLSASVSQGSEAQRRFEPWLQVLENSFDESNKAHEVVAALLAHPGSRIAAFNLQGLGKIYENIDPRFSEVKRHFKIIEDNIGQIDKWTTLGYPQKITQAKKIFAGVLRKEKWLTDDKNSPFRLTRKLLKNNSLLRDDRQALLQILGKQLEDLSAAEFEFSHLEADFGLHEMRRQIRWVMIEMQVLNGLIQFEKGEMCPAKPFLSLLNQPIATSKYAVLAERKEIENACFISRCLFVGLADQVEKFGLLKDEAESKLGDSGHDDTPPKIQAAAEIYFEEIKSSQIFSLLRQQILTCAQ